MIHTYFMTQRPFSPGAAPTKNLIDAVTFDQREYIEEIGRKAWTELHYSEPLTEKEISDYELVPYPAQ